MLDCGSFCLCNESMLLSQFSFWWREHAWLGALVLFCIGTITFTWWIAAPTFTDPDSFYHIKISQLIGRERGAIVDFPWAAFTTLKDAYVDHHFLYHVFLAPFVRFLNPIVGMKLATALLGGATIALFYLVLRTHRVPAAAVWSVLLLAAEPFAFRIGLSKAPSVGFLFLVGAFLLLHQKKYRLLGILSFFFVWSYGGFLLIIVLAAVYAAFSLFAWMRAHARRPSLREAARIALPLFVVCAGVLGGLLLHPSFPTHFRFYWEQIIQIGLINYREMIGVGAEWYPIAFHDLTAASLVLSAIMLVSIVAFVSSVSKQSTASRTAGVMALIFFLFTLKSHRYVEYYVPWAYLFVAFSLTDSGWLSRLPRAVRALAADTSQSIFHRAVGALLVLYLAMMIPGLLMGSVLLTSRSLHNGVPVDRFENVGRWLRAHSNKGDLVFHNDWDDFPALFYQSDKTVYVVGLDPTFMYRYNQDLYWKWVDITTGKRQDGVFEIIQQEFGARFVLVDDEHTAMKRVIAAEKRFKQVYRDEEVTVYRVPRTQ